MFPFITGTWNPVRGPCPYDCSYCWAKSLIKRYGYVKYQGPTRLDEKAMWKIPDKGFIFVQDMSDISTLGAQDANILMAELKAHPKATYLLLTKNPIWYLNMFGEGVIFPDNIVFGATIETNEEIKCSQAPSPGARFWGLQHVHTWMPDAKTFISVEPIMEFNLYQMINGILDAKPWAVAVGYDNYRNRLPEPPLEKTRTLIKCLREAGITVYEKTLREAWNSGAAEARVNGDNS